MTRSACLALAALCLAGSSQAERHICWIDHVEKTATGVRIYFFQDIMGGVANDAFAHRFRVNAGAVSNTIVDKKTNAERTFVTSGLDAALGDRGFVSSIPEDSCRLEVVDTPEGIAVKADAANHVLPPPFAGPEGVTAHDVIIAIPAPGAQP